MVAVKNVTVGEDFFQGHFPGAPLMPAVLMIEALTQVATLLLLEGGSIGPFASRALARRRSREVPQARRARRSSAHRGDAGVAARTRSSARARTAEVAGQPVAEADLLLVVIARLHRHRSARSRARRRGHRSRALASAPFAVVGRQRSSSAAIARSARRR